MAAEVKEVEKKEEETDGLKSLKETMSKIKESEGKEEVKEVVKKEEVKDGKKTEVVKEEVIEKKDADIPYHRFAEVNEEKKALRNQLNAMQGQMAMMQQLIMSNKGKVTKDDKEDIIELEAKALAEKQGLDIESARDLTERMYAAAKKEVSKAVSELKSQSSPTLVKNAVEEALERYPRGKAYKKEVIDMVMGLKNPDHRVDPDVIIDAAKLIVVEKIDDIEAAAEARAIKRQSEQKKIVVSGLEKPGSSSKSEIELTDAQKVWADKFKVPYEKYAARVKRA